MLDKFRMQLKSNGELYLRVKARPGAVKTIIKKILDDNTVKIDVAAPPVKGKANQELVKFLTKEFDVLKNNVNIVSGAGDRIKLIKITN